jgi:drug/metabolite transporter (DMT)-like permease
MHLSKNQKAVIALIIANTIWGAASPIFKWSLANIGIFTLAFLRFFIAAYIILPFTARNLHIRKEHILPVLFASITGISVNIGFYFLALHYTASINVPIIGSSGPIILLIFSSIFLHEKPKSKVINGMLISLIGILIVIIAPTAQNGVDMSIIGNLLLVVATIASVTQTVIAKKIAPFYDYKTIVFWEFLIGSVTFFPLMLNEVRLYGFLPNLGLPGIIGILFGALLSSAAGYLLYHYALKYMTAGESGVFTYLDPITAIIIAVPLLHETISFAYVIGASLVFLGIYLAEGRIHYHPVHMLKEMSDGLKSII